MRRAGLDMPKCVTPLIANSDAEFLSFMIGFAKTRIRIFALSYDASDLADDVNGQLPLSGGSIF